MAKRARLLLVSGAVCIALAVAFFGYRHVQHDNLLRGDRTLLRQACTHVQVSLRLNARTIRKRGEGELQNRLAADLIRRVYGDGDSAGEGPTMLAICAPRFPLDEWTACRDKGDDACLIRILESTAEAIIQRYGRGNG